MAVRGPKQYRFFGYFGCKVHLYCSLSCTIRKYCPFTVSGKRKVIKLCQLSRNPILMIFSLLKSTIEVGVGVCVAVGVLLGIWVGVTVGEGVSVGRAVGKGVSEGSRVALGAFAKDRPPELPAAQSARIKDAHNRIEKRITERSLTMKIF